MDVINFLLESIGSSTVQLHDNLGSRRAWACSEAGAKDIHKEMFPVYGGKCSSRKAVHNWVDKFSEGRWKVADDARPDAEVAKTTVKRLLCCGFRRTGKAMGQVYQCWRICREMNVFSRFEYLILYVLYPFVTYLLIPLLQFPQSGQTCNQTTGALGTNWWKVVHQLEKVPQTLIGPSGMNIQWNNTVWTETEIRIFLISTLISLLPTGYCRFPFCLRVGSLFLLTVWWILTPPEGRFHFRHPVMLYTFLIDIFSVISRWCYFTSTEIYYSA
jgi:hypothetical protein